MIAPSTAESPSQLTPKTYGQHPEVEGELENFQKQLITLAVEVHDYFRDETPYSINLSNFEKFINEALTDGTENISFEYKRLNGLGKVEDNVLELKDLLLDPQIDTDVKQTAMNQLMTVYEKSADSGVERHHQQIHRAILMLKSEKLGIRRNLELATYQIILTAAHNYLKSCSQNLTAQNVEQLISAVKNEYGLTESTIGTQFLKYMVHSKLTQEELKIGHLSQERVEEFHEVIRPFLTPVRLAEKLGETVVSSLPDSDISENLKLANTTYQVVQLKSKQQQKMVASPVEELPLESSVEVIDVDGKHVFLKFDDEILQEANSNGNERLESYRRAVSNLMFQVLPTSITEGLEQYSSSTDGKVKVLLDCQGRFWASSDPDRELKPVDVKTLRQTNFEFSVNDEKEFHIQCELLSQALNHSFEFEEIRPFLEKLLAGLETNPEVQIYRQVNCRSDKTMALKIRSEFNEKNYKKFCYRTLAPKLAASFKLGTQNFEKLERWVQSQEQVELITRLPLLIPTEAVTGVVSQNMWGLLLTSKEHVYLSSEKLKDAIKSNNILKMKAWLDSGRGEGANIKLTFWKRAHNEEQSEGYTYPLHYAVASENLLALQTLLYYRPGINAQDSCGDTAFHIAAATCNSEALALLLKINGANPNLSNGHDPRSNTAVTPLEKAIEAGDLKCINLLIEHKEVINQFSKMSPIKLKEMHRRWLMLAIRNDHADIVEFLLDNYLDVNELLKCEQWADSDTPFAYAIKWHKNNVVRRLFSNEKLSTKAKGFRLKTPLHIAARFGNKEAVKLMLTSLTPAQIKQRDLNLSTACQEAKKGHFKEIANLISQHLSKPAPKEDEASEEKFLHVQRLPSQEPMSHRVTEMRMIPTPSPFFFALSTSAEQAIFCTPLHKAIVEGSDEEFKGLELTVDTVYQVDSDGNTALHLVCKLGRKAMLKKILDHFKSLDLAKENIDGHTPLDLAIMSGDIEIIRALYLRPDLPSKELLHEAVKLGQLDIIKHLLEHGLDIGEDEDEDEDEFSLIEPRLELNYKDIHGDTIMHLALKQKNYELAIKLVEYLSSRADKPKQKGKIYAQQVNMNSENNHGHSVRKLISQSPEAVQIQITDALSQKVLAAKEVEVEKADESKYQKSNRDMRQYQNVDFSSTRKRPHLYEDVNPVSISTVEATSTTNTERTSSSITQNVKDLTQVQQLVERQSADQPTLLAIKFEDVFVHNCVSKKGQFSVEEVKEGMATWIREIKKSKPKLKVMVICESDKQHFLDAAVKAGIVDLFTGGTVDGLTYDHFAPASIKSYLKQLKAGKPSYAPSKIILVSDDYTELNDSISSNPQQQFEAIHFIGGLPKKHEFCIRGFFHKYDWEFDNWGKYQYSPLMDEMVEEYEAYQGTKEVKVYL